MRCFLFISRVHIKLSNVTCKTGHIAVFLCLFMSIFQWTWAVKGAPSFVNTSPSKQHLCNYLYPWLLLTGGLRARSRGGRVWLSWQLCERVDPQKKAAQESVLPTCPSAFSLQTFRDTVPSTCWVLWQPFAVSILSLQICCLFSSSAKSKQRDCSDMPTNMALLLVRQPSNPCFQTKHSLQLFKDGPLIPPSIHPSRTQK